MGQNASGYTQDALDAISAYIGTHFVSFKIETHEDEFISTIKAAIKSGDIIRTHDNLTASLMHKNAAPVFSLAGKIYELSNKEGYRQF